MPPGRPPKSDKEKKDRGTFRPSRSTGNDVTTPPKYKPKGGRRRKSAIVIHELSDDARKMYDHSIQILQSYKLITDFDYHLVTVMCNEFDTYIKMKDLPEIEYNPDSGLSIVHASVRIKKIALDNMMKIAVQLNLTTAMRIRIKTKDEGDGPDPLSGFING